MLILRSLIYIEGQYIISDFEEALLLIDSVLEPVL